MSKSEREDVIQIDDILIANEYGPMTDRKDFPTVGAGQSHRFTIVRTDQTMDINVDFYDVRTMKKGDHEWLICDTILIQQFTELAQNLERQKQQFVWVHKNDDWNLEEVRDYLFQHFDLSPFSTMTIDSFKADRVVVGFARPDRKARVAAFAVRS